MTKHKLHPALEHWQASYPKPETWPIQKIAERLQATKETMEQWTRKLVALNSKCHSEELNHITHGIDSTTVDLDEVSRQATGYAEGFGSSIEKFANAHTTNLGDELELTELLRKFFSEHQWEGDDQ